MWDGSIPTKSHTLKIPFRNHMNIKKNDDVTNITQLIVFVFNDREGKDFSSMASVCLNIL
eukprot:m.129856 g.129856  ORF g.129856 m.129856 type:complete len:60 (+) comp13052_c0_seq7:5119-5298(+)